jgi:hypothetical protein
MDEALVFSALWWSVLCDPRLAIPRSPSASRLIHSLTFSGSETLERLRAGVPWCERFGSIQISADCLRENRMTAVAGRCLLEEGLLAALDGRHQA